MRNADKIEELIREHAIWEKRNVSSTYGLACIPVPKVPPELFTAACDQMRISLQDREGNYLLIMDDGRGWGQWSHGMEHPLAYVVQLHEPTVSDALQEWLGDVTPEDLTNDQDAWCAFAMEYAPDLLPRDTAVRCLKGMRRTDPKVVAVIDRFGWDCAWPVIDADGDLTGEVWTEGMIDSHRKVEITADNLSMVEVEEED